MPYIKKIDRENYDSIIELAIKEFNRNQVGYGYDACMTGKKCLPVGDINYMMSSILYKLFDDKPSYVRGNEIVGVLECIKQEFIRRRLNDYENIKIEENGDI